MVTVELLADDLREVRALLPSHGDDPDALGRLLEEALRIYRSDEVRWASLERRHDAGGAEALELKRRETVALLVSMRAWTVCSEMVMDELQRRVRSLEDRHVGLRERADELQRSVARLRRRIAFLEDRLTDRAAVAPPASLRRRLLARIRNPHGRA